MKTDCSYKQIALLLSDPEKISGRKLAHMLNVSETQIRKAKKYAAEQAKDKRQADARLDQVRAILQHALSLKANAGGAIKTEIQRALELLDYERELF